MYDVGACGGKWLDAGAVPQPISAAPAVCTVAQLRLNPRACMHNDGKRGRGISAEASHAGHERIESTPKMSSTAKIDTMSAPQPDKNPRSKIPEPDYRPDAPQRSHYQAYANSKEKPRTKLPDLEYSAPQRMHYQTYADREERPRTRISDSFHRAKRDPQTPGLIYQAYADREERPRTWTFADSRHLIKRLKAKYSRKANSAGRPPHQLERDKHFTYNASEEDDEDVVHVIETDTARPVRRFSNIKPTTNSSATRGEQRSSTR